MSKKLDDLIKAAETVVALWTADKLASADSGEMWPEGDLALADLSDALINLQAEIALSEGNNNVN